MLKKIGIILFSMILVFCIGGCGSQMQDEFGDRMEISPKDQTEDEGIPCDSGIDKINGGHVRHIELDYSKIEIVGRVG